MCHCQPLKVRFPAQVALRGSLLICYSLPILVDMWSHHTCLYFQKCQWIENQVGSKHQTQNRARHRVLWLNQKPQHQHRYQHRLQHQHQHQSPLMFKSLNYQSLMRPFCQICFKHIGFTSLLDLGAEAWESFTAVALPVCCRQLLKRAYQSMLS